MGSRMHNVGMRTSAGLRDLAPLRVLNPTGGANIVITCDHASNLVPDALAGLGLSQSDLERHIGWDIGAADIATHLARRLDATAVVSGVSRLVIDCNRYLEDPSSIPEVSDGTPVPANVNLSQSERRSRQEHWFWPYHRALDDVIASRLRAGRMPILVSIHSMTDRMAGRFRPWHIALSSGPDRRLSDPVLASLQKVAGLIVGDNEPYALVPTEDFSTTRHAINHGLHHVQVEFRQDLVGTPDAAARHADLFLEALIAGLRTIGRDAAGFEHA
jgi:predicted N-formylglutamate amidohydrolase